MRLWHYELLPYIPTSQLIAQWRELNCIFKAGKDRINHILINYVKEYDDSHLFAYTQMVLKEMTNRGILVKDFSNMAQYFKCGAISLTEIKIIKPFPKHHTMRYLSQCYYNLQEKYDRGQKDFSYDRYEKLSKFYVEKLRSTYHDEQNN